jgi:hypothetical protein
MNDAQPPILELRSDALRDPCHLDLAEIEARMHFPDSAEKRIRYYRAALIEFAAQNQEHIPDGMWKELFFISRDASPIGDIQKESEDLFKKGAIVGLVLHNQIAYACLGQSSITKGQLISEATKLIKKTSTGGLIRTSPKTFNNDIWPMFHSVAHLWAAWIGANALVARSDSVFPCRLDALPSFLADAEAYRIKGETTRPRQATANILDHAETVKLPAELRVAPSELTFEPRTAA